MRGDSCIGGAIFAQGRDNCKGALEGLPEVFLSVSDCICTTKVHGGAGPGGTELRPNRG